MVGIFLKNKGVVLNRRKFLRQLGSESRGKHIEFTSVRFKIHNYFGTCNFVVEIEHSVKNCERVVKRDVFVLKTEEVYVILLVIFSMEHSGNLWDFPRKEIN